MGFGADPEEIRQLARTVRRWSDDLDSTADAVRAGFGVEWQSTAADALTEAERLARNGAQELGRRSGISGPWPLPGSPAWENLANGLGRVGA